MKPMDWLVVYWVKLIAVLIRRLRLGVGATWPGEIALRFRPNILRTLTSDKHIQIILVAGTNGKTTTVKMLEAILVHAGKRVHRNASGANLKNGIASSLIEAVGLGGGYRASHFIFEVDEAALTEVLEQTNPTIIVLLNLFRDQLDRYGEVDTVGANWLRALARYRESTYQNISTGRLDTGNQYIRKHQTTFVLNADDPHLAYIGAQLRARVAYFGLDDPSLYLSKMQHATDTIYCPKCGSRLTFGGVYFSHLGKWACGKCGLTHPDVAVSAKDYGSPIEGLYNVYNSLAAALTAEIIGIDKTKITQGLKAFTPAFGRMETLYIHGKHIKILLSKNPTGFNESLRAVLASKDKGPLLLVLNDRTPDGTDVSWIWDVDFEVLSSHKEPIVVSGDRCYDLALRLKYAGLPINDKGIYRNLEESIKTSLEATKPGETLWILPTYSAMLEVRKVLTGRKIL